MQTLTKAWNKAPAGTEITDDPAEAKKGGRKVVLVDSARLAHLAKHGFFRVKKEAVPEAEEGKNVVDPRLDVVVDSEPGVSVPGPPRPDSGPKGDR